jgi:hypothetical protein
MRVILTTQETHWFQREKGSWIESIEDSELNNGNSIVVLKQFVLPTELFDAGREYQLYLVNKHLHNEI